MMYIDMSKLPAISLKWKQKAELCLTQMKSEPDRIKRNDIIDRYRGYWKVFKEQLKSISYNKCWYSETKNPYSHYHVDHFRPKKKVVELDGTELDGYWWLAFDLTNFRLCGSVGNTKKVDNFAVKFNRVTVPGPIDDEVIYLLDPTSKEDVKLLNFDNEGKAIPSRPIDKEKWNYERADYTIKNLDLNYPDLVEERKMKWQAVTILIKKINGLNTVFNNEPTNSNKSKLDAEISKIKSMLSPSEELTATVKACLRSSGQDWAYQILEEQII